MTNIHLEAPNVILDELNEEDAHGVFMYASHDQVANTSIWEPHKDIQESKTYIQNVRRRISLEPGKIFLAWAVREKSSPDLIGAITLTQLGDIRAQIGFSFHYDHWRRRIPIEALREVLGWSFSNFPEFQRIQARCLPHNVHSNSLLENLGMLFEGINRAMVNVRGQPADLSCYAMTRQSWLISSENKGREFIHFEDNEGHI